MLSNAIIYSTVALSFFGTAFATPHTTPGVSAMSSTETASASTGTYAASPTPAVYSSFGDYTDDLTDCINTCWSDIWDFATTICDDSDIKCVCLIPEPNLDDPELATEFGQITDCSTSCGDADLQILLNASTKLTDTCKPYLDKYGPIAPANHDYYLNALAQAEATASASTTMAPYPTSASAPFNSTLSSTVAGSFGNSTAPVMTPTSTGVAVVTANAAVANGHWEMPLLIAFVMGVGARLL